MNILKRTSAIGLSLGIAISGLTVLPQSEAQNTVPEKVIFQEDFNTLDTKKWGVFDNVNWDAEKTKDNITVQNGVMTIETARHCLSPGEKPSKNNRSVAPCTAGKITDYTSGRVSSKVKVDGSKSFRIDYRAKIDDNGIPGLRPGLWMKNTAPSCKEGVNYSPWGEFDVLEWFSEEKNKSRAGAILSCTYGKNSQGKYESLTKSEQTIQQNNSTYANKWHTWSMIYDHEKATVEFLVDNTPVQRSTYWDTYYAVKNSNTTIDTSKKGSKINLKENTKLTQSQIDEIMHDKFTIYLNDSTADMRKRKDFSSINKRNFPVQRLHIDQVKVTQYDQSPYTIAKPPMEKTAPTPKPAPTPKTNTPQYYTDKNTTGGRISQQGKPLPIPQPAGNPYNIKKGDTLYISNTEKDTFLGFDRCIQHEACSVPRSNTVIPVKVTEVKNDPRFGTVISLDKFGGWKGQPIYKNKTLIGVMQGSYFGKGYAILIPTYQEVKKIEKAQSYRPLGAVGIHKNDKTSWNPYI